MHILTGEVVHRALEVVRYRGLSIPLELNLSQKSGLSENWDAQHKGILPFMLFSDGLTT